MPFPQLCGGGAPQTAQQQERQHRRQPRIPPTVMPIGLRAKFSLPSGGSLIFDPKMILIFDPKMCFCGVRLILDFAYPGLAEPVGGSGGWEG